MNNVSLVINQLTEDQKEQLLVSFITSEYNKKMSEIEKNYKDENKKNFAKSNIVNELKNRLVKKLIDSKVAELV